MAPHAAPEAPSASPVLATPGRDHTLAGRRRLSSVPICVSATRYGKHLCPACGPLTHLTSLVTSLFISLGQCSAELSFYYYVLALHMSFARYVYCRHFSHSVTCLFIFLWVSLEEQMFHFHKINCNHFFSNGSCFFPS